MPSIIFEKGKAEDSPGLCALLRQSPMDGEVRLCLEREPDYFPGSEVQSPDPYVIVARECGTGKPVGVCCFGIREVFVNGVAAAIPYISDLRVHPDYRGGSVLARGYRYLRKLLPPESFAQSIIIRGNAKAETLLTSARAGLPHYHPYGECVSTSVSLQAGKPRLGRRSDALRIRRGEAGDIPSMQKFLDREGPSKQFFPNYRFEREFGTAYFRGLTPSDFYLAFDGANLVGFLSVWDQNGFKQTRIVGYSKILGRMRPLINGWSRLRGGFELPPCGSYLKYLSLHAVLVERNDPIIFRELVRSVYQDHAGREFGYFVCGMDSRDPLRAVLHEFPHHDIWGRHFLVTYGEGDPRESLRSGLFSIEAGRI